MSSDLHLDRDTLEIVAVAASAVAVLALLLVLVALARVRVLGKRLARSEAFAATAAPQPPPRGVDPSALRHVGVVRYDAFGDMGGRLSFSAALYDDNGDGIVLSSINGRSETRTYAKELSDLRSDLTLSPEEEQAIEAAQR